MFYQSLRKIFCGVVLGFSLISLGVSTGQAKDVSINFIANASLRITDGEHVLFTDFPYVSAAFGHMAYSYPFIIEQGNDVTTLITNRLADHFDPVTFMTLDWKVIAPSEVVGDLQKRYVELNEARDRVVAILERNRELDQAVRPDEEISVVLPDPIIKPDTIIVEENLIYGPMQINAIRTVSGETEHYSYIIEWGGKKIYLSGDTGDISHLATLPETDIAFISPWLYENARKENSLPNSKKIVIYQHKDNEIIPNCLGCIVPERGEFIPFE